MVLVCCTINFRIVLIDYERICYFIGLEIEEVSGKIHHALYVNWASAKLGLRPKWPRSEAILTTHWPMTLSPRINIRQSTGGERSGIGLAVGADCCCISFRTPLRGASIGQSSKE